MARTGLIFALAVLGTATITAAEPDALPLSVTARRPDTTVEVVRDGETVRLDVTSPFGIDAATVRRTGDAWPARLAVRLRLKGLESFRMSDGRVTVEVSASAADPTRVRASVRENGEETPIDADNPDWPEVRVERGGTPGETRFEVVPPKRLFERNPAEVTLAWVDFYRG